LNFMKAIVCILVSLVTASSAPAATSPDPPQTEIANSLVRAKIYLPDAATGFYRGTRFDWSGVVGDLQYAGHSYYGPWFTQTDPTVSDFVYRGAEIVAGPCSAVTGPVEEFGVLGYDDAKPGGTFLKIGVGLLRKPDAAHYSGYHLYEIVNGGKWSIKKSKDFVEFTQELHDPASGYGYIYRKKVSLAAGKPRMMIEHSLRNVGTRAIHTNVYDHNFLVLDKQPTDAGFTIRLPFAIATEPPLEKELAEVRKDQIVYLKTLTGQDRVYTSISGFGSNPDDYKIRIENRNVKAGMEITGDRPLSKMALWSIRSVIAVEPFLDISADPGSNLTWQYQYDYSTLPR
jgi:hypothetical protein